MCSSLCLLEWNRAPLLSAGAIVYARRMRLPTSKWRVLSLDLWWREVSFWRTWWMEKTRNNMFMYTKKKNPWLWNETESQAEVIITSDRFAGSWYRYTFLGSSASPQLDCFHEFNFLVDEPSLARSRCVPQHIYIFSGNIELQAKIVGRFAVSISVFMTITCCCCAIVSIFQLISETILFTKFHSNNEY